MSEILFNAGSEKYAPKNIGYPDLRDFLWRLRTTPATTLSRSFREVFAQFFRENCPKICFGNDSFHRCDRFRQIFVQIGAILAIFRPFELFGRFGGVNGALMAR